MKFNLVAVAVVAALCMVYAADDNTSDVNQYTAQFSSIDHVKNDLQEFTNQQLGKSYDFLVLSAVFDKHDMDRPGFEKLYRKISDKAWEDTIGLIKYQSRRGLTVSLDGVKKKVVAQPKVTMTGLLESKEITSLQFALGYEKFLAEESHGIHRKISHAHGDKSEYDPDVAHYLDEEIIEYQSGTIRKLSGYIHNLQSILGEENTVNLGLHMFDDYLNSVE